MKRIACVISLLLLLNTVPAPYYISGLEAHSSSSVQDPTTALAIITAAEAVIAKLQTLAAVLQGGALIVTNNASAELSARIQEFRRLVDDLRRPIESLNLQAQELGRQIKSATESLNTILTQQQRCLFQNTEDFLSGVANVTSELKRGIPLVSSGKPRLTSYAFDGHDTNIVPIGGGRFTIKGFKLWEEERLIPTIQLMDENRNVILRGLVAQRASDSNTISVSIDESIIRAFAGQCLQLNVKAFTKRRFRSMETTDMYLPFCVPSAYTMQFKVTASVYYQCPSRPDTRELPEQQFLYYNTSCESPSNINDIRPLSVPDGCTLISFREAFSRTRHTANVAITKEPPRILRASGTLDTADCTRVPFLGNRLNSSTIWEKKVIPIIECSVTPPPKTEAESSTAINMSLPNTTITVTLPETCDTDTSNFWFKVIPIVNGVEGAVLYEQAPIQSNRAGASSVPVTKNDLTISGTYNPQIINGRVSVSVTISSPQCRR